MNQSIIQKRSLIKAGTLSKDFSRLLLSADTSVTGGLDLKTGEYDTRKAIDHLLAAYALPGMRVLQFGFEGTEENESAASLKNTVVYTGTHDNNTTLGWFKECRTYRKEQPDGPDIVGRHSEFDHPLVIGIHVQLVVVRRQGPVMQRRLHHFHLHVGALDDSDDDGPGPSGGPLFRPSR